MVWDSSQLLIKGSNYTKCRILELCIYLYRYSNLCEGMFKIDPIVRSLAVRVRLPGVGKY